MESPKVVYDDGYVTILSLGDTKMICDKFNQLGFSSMFTHASQSDLALFKIESKLKSYVTDDFQTMQSLIDYMKKEATKEDYSYNMFAMGSFLKKLEFYSSKCKDLDEPMEFTSVPSTCNLARPSVSYYDCLIKS